MVVELRNVTTPTLDIGYEVHFHEGSQNVILLHGFPYDARCYDRVAPRLASAGCRVYIPYLRGFGPTRFRSLSTGRSGEQAALAQDLLDFVEALGIDRPLLAGFDWGGRAAVAAAALWPERFSGLLTAEGYTIYDVSASKEPASPEMECALWYQYYFRTERGRSGLLNNRQELCRLLWKQWSPAWNFDDPTFDATAVSFDNPDFVEVVLHSYRHRLGAAEGDGAYRALEARLAARPPVTVAAAVLHPRNGLFRPARPVEQDFHNLYRQESVEGAGHNLPQERPDLFADILLRFAQDIDGIR